MARRKGRPRKSGYEGENWEEGWTRLSALIKTSTMTELRIIKSKLNWTHAQLIEELIDRFGDKLLAQVASELQK